MRRPAIAELLIDRGANPSAYVPNQLGPLQTAIITGSDHDMVRRLLDAGADPNTGADEIDGAHHLSPLAAAVTANDMELVRILIDHGADIDGNNHRDLAGSTPLYLAAFQSDVEMVQYLLDNGADPNGTYDHGGPFGLSTLPPASDGQTWSDSSLRRGPIPTRR